MKRMILAAVLATAAAARADLTAGDISIIGYRSDADDALSFVTWLDLAAGTSLHFTDAGFFSDGTLRDTEDIMSWTAPAGGILAGTVVVISSPDAGSASASVGSVSAKLNGLSSSGDQIFVGTTAFPDVNDSTMPGSSYGGTLLHGINFDGSAWATTAGSANQSALPSALNAAYFNLAVPEIDNAQYTGARTGLTVAEFKAEIHNTANWTGDDDGAAFGGLNSTAFAVVPEPGSAVLLGAAGLLMLAIRRRRPSRVGG